MIAKEYAPVDADGLWDARRAAKFLGISTRSLAILVSQKRVKSVLIGRRRLFSPSDLRALIAASTV